MSNNMTAMTGGVCGKCGDFAANAAIYTSHIDAAFAAESAGHCGSNISIIYWTAAFVVFLPQLPQKPPVIAVTLFCDICICGKVTAFAAESAGHCGSNIIIIYWIAAFAVLLPQLPQKPPVITATLFCDICICGLCGKVTAFAADSAGHNILICNICGYCGFFGKNVEFCAFLKEIT